MPAARFFCLPLIALAAALLPSCDSRDAPPGQSEIRFDPPPLSYTFEVRPVLAKWCFPCHGPGDEAHLSALQLGTPEQARATWEFVEAGHPGISHVLEGAITGPEPADKAVLQRWIEEGSTFQPHWAFQSLPSRVPLPPIRDARWPRNEIDHFLLAALEANFRPPPALDAADWLERATRTLTGRPVTPEDLAGFETTAVVDADSLLEETVDRLLASPAFGETMAALWLGADPATIPANDLFTPYREWLAEAFNRNLPYDQFLHEQLAGDLVENPRPDQVLATAFNRLHLLDGKVGTPRQGLGSCPGLQPRVTITDLFYKNRSGPLSFYGTTATRRVDALGHAFLGLTLACARCHDHPTEPLTRRDYHSLVGFFNSINGNSRIDHPEVVPAPALPLPTREQQDHLYRSTLQEADTENLLRQARLDGEEDFQSWFANPDKLPVLSDLVGAFSFDQAGPTSPNQALGHDGHAERGKLPLQPGLNGKAVQFDGKIPVKLPGFFQADRWNAWTFSLLINGDQTVVNPSVLLSRTGGSGPGYHGFDLRLSHGRVIARVFRDWPSNAIGIQSADSALPHEKWALLTWTYDGSSRAEGLRLYLNGRPLATEVLANHLWKQSVVGTEEAEVPLLLGARPGDRGLPGDLLDDFQVFSRALTPIEVAQLHDPGTLPRALAGEATDALRDYYFSSIHPESRRLTRRLETERRETTLAETLIREISVMRELPDPVPVLLHDEIIPRATPGILPPLTTSEIKNHQSSIINPNRLDLARWLTRPDHPLTARVFVNRLWAHFFGEGLVAITDDLGLGSPAPANPELLDYLARDFIAHGWDVKHLCRQIVLSRTFRTTTTPQSAGQSTAPR